ncbi:MAG TPA: hypothetical protein VEB43_21145 [Anaeromyxobacter sp.]|nr:hypothetical protein [Anaeromyxobacter sp.]
MAEAETMVYGAARRLERVSWGALFAGFMVGVGVLFLLLSLGAAVGLTTVDARDLSSWKNMGIGVGIWGGISAIIASFFSAWVAGRLSTSPDRTAGMLHGAALWGLTWFVGLWMGAAAITGAARAAGSAAQTAAQAGGQAAAQQPGAAQQALQGAQQEAQEAIGQAQAQGGQIAESATTGGRAGAWGAFVAAVFTLVASGLGGAAGAAGRVKAIAEREPVSTRPLAPQRT